jgi:hypothetical protein
MFERTRRSPQGSRVKRPPDEKSPGAQVRVVVPTATAPGVGGISAVVAGITRAGISGSVGGMFESRDGALGMLVAQVTEALSRRRRRGLTLSLTLPQRCFSLFGKLAPCLGLGRKPRSVAGLLGRSPRSQLEV